MSKRVIIVESPAKSKTISSYFDDEVTVLSSVGHIRDLATSGKDRLGVDVENGFEPDYKTITGKGTLVTELKKKTKGKEVFLATDPDREGEAIAWHLAQVLGLDLKEQNRIIFREITKPAIKEAILHPRTIDLNLVNSQETRRILDRIIGFKLSSLLKSKIKSQSAGRVQSVALRLICDLEKEIEAFIPEQYHTIHAYFNEVKADYIIPKDKMIKTEEANKIVETSTNPFIVKSIDQKETKRNPKAPLITSTLQQEAINALNMSSARVMSVAQKLYEGIEINGELVGLITYMRTDSDRLSQEFVGPAKAFIEKTYGKKYVGTYRTNKNDSAQDAHEAIRPTDVERTPESVEPFLSKDEYKVYKKIYDRAVASLMSSAIFNSTKVVLDSNGNLYDLDGSVLIFEGYLKVSSDLPKNKILPNFTLNEELHATKVEAIEKYTTPPARYTEASLIKELESKGIGRPSTYASIINTLKSRDYVELKEKKFHPTKQGMLTVEELTKYFKNIMDVEYTSRMEKRLDEISEGNVNNKELLQTFYTNFIPQLQVAQKEMVKIEAEVTDKVCPLCGSLLVVRKSKYGEFYGCSGFPKCKHIEPKLS